MMLYLLQGVYSPGNERRKSEIELCLKKNSENPHIDKFLHLSSWPTYNECFAITRARGKNIYVIANSDIFFDETLALVKKYSETILDSKVCFALSRWDLLENEISHYNHADSQDAWIFFDAVPEIPGADFRLGGQAGCDNKIAYLLEQCGYQVINPSLSIKAIHAHQSGVRTNPVVYFDRLPPPYKLIASTSL